MTNSEVLSIASRTGVLLLSGGAESFRIEETVEYVGIALGLEVTCYVTLTAVIVSTTDGANSIVRKVRVSGFNLQTVDEVNDLSRKLVSRKIDPNEYQKELLRISKNVKDYPILYKVASAGCVSMAPSLFLQASLSQYILMFVIGMFGYSGYYFAKSRGTIPYSSEFVGSFVIGLMAIIANYWGLTDNATQVIFGAVMPLVPGLAITNAIREIIKGEAISGIVRALDAVLVVSALATGIAAALEFVNFV